MLSAAYIDAHVEVVRRASMVLVQLETPLETVLRLAELASEAKTPLMLDPAPAVPLAGALLSRTTWLTPNETEAQILLGNANLEPAAAAEKLRLTFEAHFWLEELGMYALALDGDKRPCRVRSSNAGQVLISGIAAPERAQRSSAGEMEAFG